MVLACWKNMSESKAGCALDIRFDRQSAIWKSVNYQYESRTNRSIGAAFLESMRSGLADEVLEYHFEEDREKTRGDLLSQAITVALNLKRLGVKRGDVVVLFSGYTYLTSSFTFGALLIGAVVNYCELGLDGGKLDATLDVVRPSVLLFEDVYWEKLHRSLERSRPCTLKHVFSIAHMNPGHKSGELFSEISGASSGDLEITPNSACQLEPAFIVLTSGSTGHPKAVQLSHALVLNGVYTWWANPSDYEPIQTTSILFSASPLRWISQVALLLQSALLGVKRICSNKSATGAYGIEILRKTRPTHMFSVPSFFRDILLQLAPDDQDSLKSLKFVQLGGEHPSKYLMDLTRRHAVKSRLFYSYGMSEVSGSITNDELISGGKLQPGYEMQVLDEDLRPLGPNRRGRLAVRTPYPFLGYKGVDGTKNLLPNGFFLNGDYGYFDSENTLHLLSRWCDLIRNATDVLVPYTVESLVLSEPDVAGACLVGFRTKPDAADEAGCLYVTIKPDSTLVQEQLLRKLWNLLHEKLGRPEATMMQRIEIVDSFPQSSCGKVDRLRLKQRAQTDHFAVPAPLRNLSECR